MSYHVEMESPIRSAHITIMTEIIEKISRMISRDFNEIPFIALEKRQKFLEKYQTKASQMMINFLYEKRPEYGIITKTEIYQEGSEFDWVINPLNGIDNFLRGISFFCCSIAVMHHDEVICSMVFDPIKRDMYYAEKGEGAFLNHKTIQVSKNIYPQKAMFGSNSEIDLKYRRLGSSLLSMVYVANGRLDGCIEHSKHVCDSVAATLIVEEAKGTVQTIRTPKNSITICSNGLLHKYIAKSAEDLQSKQSDETDSNKTDTETLN